MKWYLTILFLFLTGVLFAQQKPPLKILVNTANYSIQSIDSIQYRQYLNGSSHNSGIDTLQDKGLIEFFSPFTDYFISLKKQEGKEGSDEIALHLGNSFGSEKKLFDINLPAGYKYVQFIHWISAKSLVIKYAEVTGTGKAYLFLIFKNT